MKMALRRRANIKLVEKKAEVLALVEQIRGLVRTAEAAREFEFEPWRRAVKQLYGGG